MSCSRHDPLQKTITTGEEHQFFYENTWFDELAQNHVPVYPVQKQVYYVANSAY